MDILVKWPTKGRPELFRRTFLCWYNPRVRFVITIDSDDRSCNTPEMIRFLDLTNVRVAVSDPPAGGRTKIKAFNADLEHEQGGFDVLVLGSDDMVPLFEDWDLRIAALFRRHIPDLDGVLHLPDGRRTDDLVTLSIMGGPYYRRFGYCYHPSYISLWADNEFSEVARSLGRCVYHPEVLIRHDWVGDHGRDEMLQHTESFFQRDRANYLARRAAGFPIH